MELDSIKKVTPKRLFNMQLHDMYWGPDNKWSVFRISGGWIYTINTCSVFVPLPSIDRRGLFEFQLPEDVLTRDSLDFEDF